MLNTAPQIQYSAILDFIYPVGSYFITESENYDTVAKVQAHFGGTWVQVTERFLYGSTSAGTEGGEATHSHTLGDNGYAKVAFGWESDTNRLMMSLKTVDAYVTNTYNGASYWPDPTGTAYRGSNYMATTLGGTTNSKTTLPPYRTVYMYRRTA